MSVEMPHWPLVPKVETVRAAFVADTIDVDELDMLMGAALSGTEVEVPLPLAATLMAHAGLGSRKGLLEALESATATYSGDPYGYHPPRVPWPRIPLPWD